MTEDIIIAFAIIAVRTCVEAILIITIIRKAGFYQGWGLLIGLTPLVAFVAQSALILQGTLTPTEAVTLFAPISLAPFLLLAFKSWPVVATHLTRPET